MLTESPASHLVRAIMFTISIPLGPWVPVQCSRKVGILVAPLGIPAWSAWVTEVDNGILHEKSPKLSFELRSERTRKRHSQQTTFAFYIRGVELLTLLRTRKSFRWNSRVLLRVRLSPFSCLDTNSKIYFGQTLRHFVFTCAIMTKKL